MIQIVRCNNESIEKKYVVSSLWRYLFAGVLTEEMFVLGKNKVTTVEVVGAEKVNKKQR